MIALKVLEKAIERRDYRFLAAKIVEKLREYDWDADDIRELVRQMREQDE